MLTRIGAPAEKNLARFICSMNKKNYCLNSLFNMKF